MLITGVIAGFVFLAHSYIQIQDIKKIKEMAVLKISAIEDANAIEIELLDYDRGDYLLKYHDAPFAVRKWTLNRYTGQVIPWGAKIKKPL